MTQSIVARSDTSRPRTSGLAASRLAAAARAGTTGRRASRLGVLCAAALAVALPARAEDIEVYRALVGSKEKSNILFVLDYSGSMNRDASGAIAWQSGEPSRLDILRDTIRQVLAEPENRDSIRVGLGSLYSGAVSGVRWPVTDLDAEAHDIDPAIPPGVKAHEVIDGQLERMGATGDTRTVNALVEAAMYFRGGPVTHGGADPRRAPRHAPDTWNPVARRYEGGNPFAALAASYAPLDAHKSAYGVGEGVKRGTQADSDLCRDYTVSDGPNECVGRVTYNCEQVSAGRWRDEMGSNRDWDAHDLCRYEHPDRWHGARYRSPIEASVTEGMCRADNAIVLISDGIPDRAFDNASLQAVAGVPSMDDCAPLHEEIFGVAASNDAANGDCGPEITYRLANENQIPGVDSKVKTFTVGFSLEGTGQEYLKLLARPDELLGDTRSPEARDKAYGRYFSAGNGAELAAALQGAINAVRGENESFAEIAVDVDRATFSHDERAYFSLFKPSVERGWQGNLKGYFLDPEQGLVGLDGKPAIDDTGERTRFADDAWSFWTEKRPASPSGPAVPDGNVVTRGGASERITERSDEGDARALYTYTGDTSTLSPTSVDLAVSDSNRLLASNEAILAADLGTDETTRAAALEWLRTAPMGDPLHSRSVSVRYTGAGDAPERVVYVMTNQGLLHAIDASLPTAPVPSGTVATGGGEEIFAYMPKRLLANLPALAGLDGGTSGDTTHIYGLDGAITRWHEDANNDGIVNGSDTLMLVLGMRRGGEAYHAIDVTDPERPKLKWVIDSTTPGFGALAQSWSRASLVRVRRGEEEERVLMFGGGYDAQAIEPGGTPADAPVDSRGNAVFVVDEEGNRVRTFTHVDMEHAIAADLTVIDSDADGLADRIYAADLGGQVWRIDFDDVESTTGSAVTRLADLGGGAHQPFFDAPSVALNRRASGDFLSVTLGSGNRAAPLEPSSDNAFFMLRDTAVGKGVPADDFQPIGNSDLYDATAALVDSADADTAREARDELAAARGWRVNLASGEKSLSRLVSFDGVVFATTYTPPAGASDACSLEPVQRFYRMGIDTASPTVGDPADPASRHETLDGLGIPSAPVIVFPEGSSTVQVMVDRKTVELREQTLSRVYWHAK